MNSTSFSSVSCTLPQIFRLYKKSFGRHPSSESFWISYTPEDFWMQCHGFWCTPKDFWFWSSAFWGNQGQILQPLLASQPCLDSPKAFARPCSWRCMSVPPQPTKFMWARKFLYVTRMSGCSWSGSLAQRKLITPSKSLAGTLSRSSMVFSSNFNSENSHMKYVT